MITYFINVIPINKMLEIFLAIFPGSLLADCWKGSWGISWLIKESSSYASPKNLSWTLWCTREPHGTRLSGTGSRVMLKASLKSSIALLKCIACAGGTGYRSVCFLLWFWRSKSRRWGDDPSKRGAHQWDLNQTSVDVEGIYNKSAARCTCLGS